MRVRLLGPVDVVVDGSIRAVQGLRRKAVLAVLALHVGEIVGTDRILDAAWGDQMPSTAINTLQRHMSHLRALLGSRDAIVARMPGYVLDIGDDGTDLRVAERLINQARRSSEPTERARLLEQALGLWRGPALLDVRGLAWLDRQADRLDQLRLNATQALIETRLALGQHALVLPELRRLARDNPFDEQVHASLMLALYRSGRQAEALTTYQRVRQALADELGLDPGPALRELEAAILRQDAGELSPADARAPRPAVVPAQLPPAVPTFAGRANEIAALDDTLSTSDRPASMVVAAVSGTAGVGKTALAVHWAHRVADRFPDGQLYVNLRGYDPTGSVVDPAEAVRGFLDAFGVPVQRMPTGVAAQAALYRSLLAGKRVLVLLDNARDVEQVRQLLPGTPGCLAIVTSRNQLTGLVATEGAHLLTLGQLSPAEAADLLDRRLGSGRVDREPVAVQRIIARCARLPLALAVAAARAATHPNFPLATLAEQLRTAAGGLDVLHGGDPATDVRAVFSWSYRGLEAGAARMFRLLGLHPGPDIGASAAASLAGVPPDQARRLLTELTRAHLLVEHVPGRYVFHDLLRAYAAEQANAHDSDGERQAAISRMLDHYVHSGHNGAVLLDPNREPLDLGPPQPGVTPQRHIDRQQAMDWFATEHGVLLAATGRAGGSGASTSFDTQLWQLAWTLADHLEWRGYWHEWVAIQHAAVDATQRLGDVPAEASALRLLALACIRLGRFEEAHAHLGRALELAVRVEDRVGQAHAHLHIARVCGCLDRHEQALAHAREAFEGFLAAGVVRGQANSLNLLGWHNSQLGNHEPAVGYCEQALALAEQLTDLPIQANIWDSLGYVHDHLDDRARAVTCYQRAIDLYREVGDRYNEADTLASLGDTHEAAGDVDAACSAWRTALAILTALDQPSADRVRTKLARAATARRWGRDDPTSAVAMPSGTPG
jgi:DNA-binding SARP family transcriptional activator/Tfp pilus assembly protein PilF